MILVTYKGKSAYIILTHCQQDTMKKQKNKILLCAQQVRTNNQ